MKGTPLVVAEFGEKLQKRLWDMDKQLERRVTNLEQWSEDTGVSLNAAAKDHVENLEHCW